MASKYLRPATATASYEILCKLGLVEFCLYLAGAFPGSTLFGPIPVQKLCLLALLAQTAMIVCFAIKDGARFTIHIKWYYVFAFICFLSLFFTTGDLGNDDFYSIIICCCLLVVQAIYVNNMERFKLICWCYVIVSDINSIMFYMNGQLTLKAGQRLGENMGVNSNYLATYLMYSTIYAMWLLYVEKSKWKKILIIALMLIVMYPLTLTGSRKYFLAPALFFTLIMMKKDTGEQFSFLKKLLGVAVILIVGGFLVMNVPAIYNSLGVRIEGLMNSFTGKGEVDASTEVRGELRKLALIGWTESPIWGSGFDTFKYYSQAHGMGLIYSHSNYTELLYNGGIIFFVAYYYIHAKIMIQCINEKKDGDIFKVFCIAGILVQLFFDYGGVSYNQFQCQSFMGMIFFALRTPYFDEEIIKIKERGK